MRIILRLEETLPGTGQTVSAEYTMDLEIFSQLRNDQTEGILDPMVTRLATAVSKKIRVLKNETAKK